MKRRAWRELDRRFLKPKADFKWDDGLGLDRDSFRFRKRIDLFKAQAEQAAEKGVILASGYRGVNRG